MVIENDEDIAVGGKGTIVQIEESKFGKGKKKTVGDIALRGLKYLVALKWVLAIGITTSTSVWWWRTAVRLLCYH